MIIQLFLDGERSSCFNFEHEKAQTKGIESPQADRSLRHCRPRPRPDSVMKLSSSRKKLVLIPLECLRALAQET